MKTKNKLSLLTSVLLTLLLGITLTGCGGGGGSDDGAAFIGQWTGVEMNDGGEITDLTAYADLGLEITLSINDDGTLAVDILGDSNSGTWKGKNASTISVTIDGEAFDAKLSGNQVTFDSGDGSSILFEKA